MKEALKLEIEHHELPDGINLYIASFPNIKGLCETGETQRQAFEELMMSLKVKIAYDNNFQL